MDRLIRSSFSLMGSGMKILLSIKRGGFFMTGLNPIWERMSFSMSIPGATSMSSMPFLVRERTQRSVMKSTGVPFFTACLPLNVTCSTALRNFFSVPSSSILSLPSMTEILSPLAVKVPTKTTFLALWLMLMNPPQPANFGPNLLPFRLPSLSAWARPRKQQSRPPPS